MSVHDVYSLDAGLDPDRKFFTYEVYDDIIFYQILDAVTERLGNLISMYKT